MALLPFSGAPPTTPPDGVATLVAGTVTVSAPSVDATSLILLTGQNSSGTAGELTISSITNGVGFTITSASNTDTRSVGWVIFEYTPAVVSGNGPWLSLGLSNV